MGEHTPAAGGGAQRIYAEFSLYGQGRFKVRPGPYGADAPSRRCGSKKHRGRQSCYSFNDLAEVEFTAKITSLVAEGTAAAEGVYDRSFTKDGLLVNALHHERLSDIGAATTLNDNTVDVRPC